MPDDDRALMERLAALEAEVKQDADAQRARKEAAMAKVREERAKAEAEKAELRSRQASLVRRKPAEPADDEDDGVFERLRRRNASEADHADGIGGAIELAGKANRLKGELAKPTKKGEKSWVKSGVLSLFLGPVGWLYAGSWREAAPASAAWLLFLAIMSKLSIFSFLFIPILAVLMPLSGIAGAVYALSYNRNNGKRQRLFGEDKKKLLPEKSGK